MLQVYVIEGGDVLTPGAPLSAEGRDGLKRLLRDTVVGRIKNFDCVISWPIRAADAMAQMIAPKARKITHFPEMGPENSYLMDWVKYRHFRASHPVRVTKEESVANVQLFTCLAMHVEENLALILAAAPQNAEVGVVVLPRPIAEIMFAQATKASPMWTFSQGAAFVVNFNREGRVCEPSPRLIKLALA